MNKIEIQLTPQTMHVFSCRISVLDLQGKQCEEYKVKIDAKTSSVSCPLNISADEFEGKIIRIMVCGISPNDDNKDYALQTEVLICGQPKWEDIIKGQNGATEATKFPPS